MGCAPKISMTWASDRSAVPIAGDAVQDMILPTLEPSDLAASEWGWLNGHSVRSPGVVVTEFRREWSRLRMPAFQLESAGYRIALLHCTRQLERSSSEPTLSTAG